jgi:transcriptional regulator with GAF, ATPase, and Fis domain
LAETPIPSEETMVLPYREAEIEFDYRILSQALRSTGGNALEAARLLDLPISTFRYKLRRIGIDLHKEFRTE